MGLIYAPDGTYTTLMTCRWDQALTPDEFRPAVARGAGFLDRVLSAPEWRPRINEATLRLESETCCVLGQLFSGGYSYGSNRLRLGIHEEIAYGFYVPGPVQVHYPNSWSVLTEAWRRELARA
jgi:hypothetical protein